MASKKPLPPWLAPKKGADMPKKGTKPAAPFKKK